MKDRNDRIRELAFSLWEGEGCPEGQEDRHWREAEAALEQDMERKIAEGEPQGESFAEDHPSAQVRASH